MKTCRICDKDLDDSLFGKNRKICKECAHIKYQTKFCDTCGFLISKTSKSCKKCKQNIQNKICTKCKENLPIDCFGSRLSKFRSVCKKCEAKRVKRYRLDNIDKVKKYKKEYKNPKLQKLMQIRGKLKKDCKNIPEEKRYELANSIYNSKNCDCCGEEFKNLKDKSIDHCHKNLIYRGTLCRKCNVTLGFMCDSIEKLQFCINYLRKFK